MILDLMGLKRNVINHVVILKLKEQLGMGLVHVRKKQIVMENNVVVPDTVLIVFKMQLTPRAVGYVLRSFMDSV